MTAETARRIVNLLVESEHSGEALGEALGCSRAAVWKQVEALRALGLPIEAAAGKGYRLNRPIEWLDAAGIEESLSERARTQLGSLEIAWQLDSTNAEVLRRAPGSRHGLCILAEGQTAGRGRRGRSWASPFACNLYLSLGWRFDTGIAALAEWPLAVAVAVCRSLETIGLKEHGVKWPNDLILEDRKLGGCLVEVQGDASGPCTAVMGVGLNVNMDPQGTGDIDQPWTQLSDWVDDASRNAMAAVLLENLLGAATDFARSGFASFRDDWERFDRLRGRDVIVLQDPGGATGRASGISERGGLLVQTAEGLREFHAGEVSVRPGEAP